MTSANDTPNGDFDERLSQAFSDALNDGEQLVAQETGDQGQAIALSKTRILVAKAGLAGTGELDGHKVSAFDLEAVTSVNLRKGPLGAVIQICAEGSAASAQNGTPDNVIVFTGPGRVKRAEAFAAQIEFLTGKAVNRVDPTAKHSPHPVEVHEAAAPAEAAPAPQAGRKPKSLAEEIYSEVVEAEKKPEVPDLTTRTEASHQTPVVMSSISDIVDESEDDDEAPSTEYRPNPNLPKPILQRKRGPNSVLVLLGVTAGLVLIGLAVMAPVREAQIKSASVEDTIVSTNRKTVLTNLSAVSDYKDQVSGLMAGADSEAAKLRSAVATGNKAAAKAVGEAAQTDAALNSIAAMAAPPGLAEAKQNLTSGLLVQKTAIVAAAATAETQEPLPAKQTLARLTEASAQIRKGLAAIARAQSELEKQSAAPTSTRRK